MRAYATHPRPAPSGWTMISPSVLVCQSRGPCQPAPPAERLRNVKRRAARSRPAPSAVRAADRSVQRGAACTSGNQCEKNLQCFNGVCALPGGVGTRCTNSFGCQYPLSCMIDRCEESANAGESCASKPCNDRDGLFCNSGVCQLWQLAGTGEPCNNFDFRFCSRAGLCVSTGGSGEGSCVAAAAVGEPCNNTTGPLCLPWAQCVRGLCKIGDPGMCK